MQLIDFIHQLATWRKEKGEMAILPLAHEPVEEPFLKLEERKLLLHATVLQKKIERMQAMVTKLQQHIAELSEELSQLKNQASINFTVATGETLSFDLRDRKLFQDFWKKGEGHGESGAPQASGIKPTQIPPSRYYDSSLLPQESDDLLFYVS